MAEEPAAATRLARQMTDAEAFLWSVEKDPWFASTIGTVLVCEGSIDPERLRRRIAGAVLELPRLRERVLPRFGRLAPPRWRTDPEFELDDHRRRLSLPPPGSRAQLLELATRLLQDPFDRTRPLWQFWLVEGLDRPSGDSALVIKLHHSVTDGRGGVKLAEQTWISPPTPRSSPRWTSTTSSARRWPPRPVRAAAPSTRSRWERPPCRPPGTAPAGTSASPGGWRRRRR